MWLSSCEFDADQLRRFRRVRTLQRGRGGGVEPIRPEAQCPLARQQR
jgi:hypothetical protein